MKKMILGLSLLLGASQGHAADANASYTIRQIITARSTVIVEPAKDSTAELPTIGDLFVVTFADGKQCSLKVKSLKNKLINLDSSDCPQQNEITTKLHVERALLDADTTEPVKAQSNPQQEWGQGQVVPSAGVRWAASLYLSGGKDLTFRDAKAGGSSGEVKFETESTLGVAVSLVKNDRYSWGYNLTAGYEGARKFKFIQIDSGGSTTYGSISDGPTLSFFYLEGDLNYRWDDFYLPFGLNISIPILKNSSSSKLSASSSVGLMVGAGYFVTDNLALEFVVRTLGVTMTAPSNVDYGYGVIGSGSIGAKYHF